MFEQSESMSNAGTYANTPARRVSNSALILDFEASVVIIFPVQSWSGDESNNLNINPLHVEPDNPLGNQPPASGRRVGE